MQLTLPPFQSLDFSQYDTKLKNLLTQNLHAIAKLAAQENPTWDNLIYPLDIMQNTLEKFFSPLSHLHAVVNSEHLRTLYQACLPQLSRYHTEIGQNKALYKAIRAIDTQALNPTQQKIMSDMLRDFTLSGVALDTHKQQKFEKITTRLSELANQFDNHVLDATQSYTLPVSETEAQGLPEHAYHAARALATEKGISGLILTLDAPCYQAVMSYVDDRAVRQQMHHAYITRASQQGPDAGKFDNSGIMNEILALRHEKAQLLGFPHYAACSLASKMAQSPELVFSFLHDLAHKAYAKARSEWADLTHFARENYHIDPVKPWDIAWLSEKMKQTQYHFSEEDLRPYFPQNKVLTGLFDIASRLYGIQFSQITAETWHPDVIVYNVHDANNNIRGTLYLDLYARTNKRGGAWMDSLQGRFRLDDGHTQAPIATLTCNFAKPKPGQVATFSHDEVLTLFHEFGHCLHHVLTQVDYLGASGINGVEWDAVELPSQFFENWCYHPEALALLTEHADTHAPLPDTLLDKLLATKNFQSAMRMMRQLEFALFDFSIHAQYQASPTFIRTTLDAVRKQVSVVPIAPENAFENSFSHIFAGGYAAGYYSYKWAEVLSYDAFDRFEKEGIFNPETGRAFLHHILEAGGSRPAHTSFVAFRGREPAIEPLLRHEGILEDRLTA